MTVFWGLVLGVALAVAWDMWMALRDERATLDAYWAAEQERCELTVHRHGAYPQGLGYHVADFRLDLGPWPPRQPLSPAQLRASEREAMRVLDARVRIARETT